MANGLIEAVSLGILELLLFIAAIFFFKNSESFAIIILVVGVVLVVTYMIFLKHLVDKWAEKIEFTEHGEKGFENQQEIFNKMPALVPLKPLQEKILRTALR